jgi:hypothetical protein
MEPLPVPVNLVTREMPPPGNVQVGRMHSYALALYLLCLDINECVLNADLCNKESSSCVNTPGSYRCDCLAGYEV